MIKNKRVAIVCDRIKDMWWAEVVLEQFLEIFPQADIFTSVFWQKDNKVFKWRKIKSSFIQSIPFLNKSHKLALILRPIAFESFDLSSYDIVISSSSAESKGVITKPDTLFICYCHTPTRYFWSHYHEYLNMMEFWLLNIVWRYLMPKIVHKLRTRDFCAAQRPDKFIANSKNTASRIKKYYSREAKVIYPCIDTSVFKTNNKKQDFYLYIGRCIPYKKFDLIVEAFNKNKKKIVIVTNTDNKLYRDLQNNSKKNIERKLNISREQTINLLASTKAFLFPPEEDFWLLPLEAMASWTPVIAYKKWWALETVIDGENWVFFNEQTSESLNLAIEKFETMSFDYKKIRKHAINFDKKVFKKHIVSFVEKNL